MPGFNTYTHKFCRFIISLNCFIILMVFSQVQVNAQNVDSARVLNTDSNKVKKHSPKKAAIMSAILPGLGQAYNRKYWKIPLVYAGAGAVTYIAIFNYGYYSKFKEAYQFRTDDDPNTVDQYPEYENDQLITLRDSYRRNLELSIIFGVGIYALNVIDASVDAHLYKFDISDDLSFQVNPVFYSLQKNSVAGLSLSITFGRKLRQPSSNYN